MQYIKTAARGFSPAAFVFLIAAMSLCAAVMIYALTEYSQDKTLLGIIAYRKAFLIMQSAWLSLCLGVGGALLIDIGVRA